ncbi:MAG: 4Fe-4S dicluster domain-containing protein [candidate division WOR-3 bacterium]
MTILFLPKEKFNAWLAKLHDNYTIYYPAPIENKIHYKKLDKKFFDNPFYSIADALTQIRPVESLKGFFYRPKEKVGGLVNKSKVEIPFDESPQIIIGAKSCDIKPLMVHQKMYLENEFGEPFYKAQRERTIIIAADCPQPEQTCFCNLLGLKPFVEFGADISLTVLANGYIFEALNSKGENLLRDFDHLFQAATTDDLTRRDNIRKQSISELEKINPTKWRADLSDAINQLKSEKFWQEAGESCVECFGCLLVCPTCFCFLLYDTPLSDAPKAFERYKIWDACYYPAYARVGGGMNARPEFWQRFRNRFHCKFMNFPNDFGFNACSGCGRCFSVCMGKIDIRKILAKI